MRCILKPIPDPTPHIPNAISDSTLTNCIHHSAYLTVLNGTQIFTVLADENIGNPEKSACVRVHLRPIGIA